MLSRNPFNGCILLAASSFAAAVYFAPKDSGGIDGDHAYGRRGSDLVLSEGAPGAWAVARAGAGTSARSFARAFAGAEDDNYDLGKEEDANLARGDVIMCRHAGRPLPPPIPPTLSSGERKLHHSGNDSDGGSRGRSDSSSRRGSLGSTTDDGDRGDAWPRSSRGRESLSLWGGHNDNPLHGGDSSPDVVQGSQRGGGGAQSILPRIPRDGDGGGRVVEDEALLPARKGAGAAVTTALAGAAAGAAMISSPPRLMRHRMTPDGSLVVADTGRVKVPLSERRNRRRHSRKPVEPGVKKAHDLSRSASVPEFTSDTKKAALCDSSDDEIDDDDDTNNSYAPRLPQHEDDEEERWQQQQQCPLGGAREGLRLGASVKSDGTIGISGGSRKTNSRKGRRARSNSLPFGGRGGSTGGSQFLDKLKGMLRLTPTQPRTPAVRRKSRFGL